MNIKTFVSVFSLKNITLILGIALLAVCGLLFIRRLQAKHSFSAPVFAEAVVANVYDTWKNFPGASETKDGGVRFSPINRKIVEQDGSGGQDNPPVNVNGQHIKTTGDFTVSLKLSELRGSRMQLHLYGEVPVIYDEWRYEGKSVSVEVKDQTATISQWGGLSEQPVIVKTFLFGDADAATLTFTVTNNRMLIAINDTTLIALNAKGLLPTGRLWLGADADGDGWTLDSMSLGGNAQLESSLSSGKQTASENLASLATAHRASLKVGAAVSLYPLMTDQKYRDLALSEFSIWTPENEMKAQFLHPGRTVYTFEEADMLVAQAEKNGIAIHGHALVFGEANPAWMQNTPKDELEAVMKEHITTVMDHFKGQVREWDVINEPLSEEYTPDGLRRSIWYNALGKDFIATALRTARAADPEAKLYINEYGLEEDGERWDTFLRLVTKLRADNVPLDGVGFQAHIYEKADEVDANVLRSHIQQLAKIGIVSRVSEVDVHGENAERQAQQYEALLKACMDEPSCSSFSTWGITDRYGSTTSDHTYPPEYGDDLLWDSSYAPKKAYQRLISRLKP